MSDGFPGTKHHIKPSTSIYNYCMYCLTKVTNSFDLWETVWPLNILINNTISSWICCAKNELMISFLFWFRVIYIVYYTPKDIHTSVLFCCVVFSWSVLNGNMWSIQLCYIRLFNWLLDIHNPIVFLIILFIFIRIISCSFVYSSLTLILGYLAMGIGLLLRHDAVAIIVANGRAAFFESCAVIGWKDGGSVRSL